MGTGVVFRGDGGSPPHSQNGGEPDRDLRSSPRTQRHRPWPGRDRTGCPAHGQDHDLMGCTPTVPFKDEHLTGVGKSSRSQAEPGSDQRKIRCPEPGDRSRFSWTAKPEPRTMAGSPSPVAEVRHVRRSSGSAEPRGGADHAPARRSAEPQRRDAAAGRSPPGTSAGGRPLPAGPRVRGPGGAGPRRHGRRLPGPAGAGRPPRGPEDDPGRRPRRRGGAGPLPHRGRGHRPPAAPQHRADLRGRRARRPSLLLAGVLRRGVAGGPTPKDSAGTPRGGGARREPGAGHARRPREGGAPPRPEARQRFARRGRYAEGHRLRARQEAGRGRPNGDWRRHGHAQLHGPGAGPGPVAGDRAGVRRVRPGGDPVRVPHGPPPLQGGDGDRHHHAGRRRRAGTADAAAVVGAARPGDRLSEMPAERAP